MNLRCVAVFTGVILLALTGVAAAQVPMIGTLPSFDSAPAAPPPGTGFPPPSAARGPQAGPPGAPPPGQEPPCFKDFMPLREEAQKRAGLIKQASDRKAPREEVCQLFKNFAASEAKVVKFVTENHASCGIPGEVVTQMKGNHGQTLKIRQQVCSGGPVGAGAKPAAPPPMPKLSDELGVRGITGPTGGSTGRGTFDTLTGNALER